MIVTSRTCFLNILTQLYDKETLLKASYYIADLTGPDGHAHLNPNRPDLQEQMGSFEDITSWKYNEDGQLVKRTGDPVTVDTMQKYNIVYTIGTLNPTSMITMLKMGPEVSNGVRLSPEERFINSLKDPVQQSQLYHEMFYHKPKGNGLQILIYMNDEICTRFGWIACEFLSSCFGADIIFIDAKYRKKIAKQSKPFYQGNKEYAMKVFIPQLRDWETVDAFHKNMTKSNLRECVNNITTKLSLMNWAGLIHLYNLLWPNDPLPRGNYSEEQLREIIMHRTVGSRKPNVYDELDNMYASNEFDQMANEYDQY